MLGSRMLASYHEQRGRGHRQAREGTWQSIRNLPFSTFYFANILTLVTIIILHIIVVIIRNPVRFSPDR